MPAMPRCYSTASRVCGKILNDVVLNQVLVRVGDAEMTNRVESLVQSDGVCWLGATTWRGEHFLNLGLETGGRRVVCELTVDAIARAPRWRYRAFGVTGQIDRG